MKKTYFLIFLFVVTLNFAASATMKISQYSTVVEVRDDYVLSCREVFVFSYDSGTLNQTTLTWYYKLEDIDFHYVKLREGTSAGVGADVNYTLSPFWILSITNPYGFEMTISNITLVADIEYTLEMTYLVKNQITK